MSLDTAVTVVMRTKDSAWVVERAVAGLFSQQNVSFELLVVDSGSQDQTLELLEPYAHRRIDVERGSYVPGRVLNRAIAACDTPWIAFQNSDVVPLDPFVLERLLTAAQQHDCVATFARQVPRPEAWQSVRRDHEQAFPATRTNPDWLPLSLPMALIRRDALIARPFYNGAWASEDTEWGHWARTAGHRVKYVPEACVMHSHNYTLRELRGRKFVEGEADAVMTGSSASWPRIAARALRESYRDARYCLTHQALGEVPGAIARRCVGNWAYWRGRTLGMRRVRRNDHDLSFGQKFALSRHRQ